MPFDFAQVLVFMVIALGFVLAMLAQKKQTTPTSETFEGTPAKVIRALNGLEERLTAAKQKRRYIVIGTPLSSILVFLIAGLSSSSVSSVFSSVLILVGAALMIMWPMITIGTAKIGAINEHKMDFVRFLIGEAAPNSAKGTVTIDPRPYFFGSKSNRRSNWKKNMNMTLGEALESAGETLTIRLSWLDLDLPLEELGTVNLRMTTICNRLVQRKLFDHGGMFKVKNKIFEEIIVSFKSAENGSGFSTKVPEVAEINRLLKTRSIRVVDLAASSANVTVKLRGSPTGSIDENRLDRAFGAHLLNAVRVVHALLSKNQ